MKLFRRMTALFLGCVLLAGTALAHAQGWDSLTSVYLDQDSDVYFALSAQFEELVPYGDSPLRICEFPIGVVKEEKQKEVK